jgi:uncharacterized protein (TIGR02246 family)
MMRAKIAILCCIVSTTPWFAQDNARRNDEAAIREVVSKYVDARERVDPKAVEELFTSDADQLVSSGEWRKGRDAVVRGTMESSRNTGGKRTITVESVRMLTPDVAIADGRYELTGLAGGATRSMWTTLVLKRTEKGWRISAIRNMLPAVPAQSPAPGVIKSEFIYENAPFPQCHASTIAESKGGLVAAWFGGTREKHPDVGIWTSRFEDGKWTTPVEVANGVESPEKRYPTWNPALYQMKSGVESGSKAGPLLLFYKVGPSPSEWWGMIMTSEDGGKTWSKPRRLPDGIAGPIKNKPVEIGDGALLCPSSTEDNGWRVHFEYTADLGKTWRRTDAINDGKEFGVIQPTVFLHKGGRLQALMRSRQGKIVESWSDDNGKTWGKLSATVLPNPNSGIDGVTLKDGRHLLVYNHVVTQSGKWGGRAPLNVAVSEDGKTWKAALALETGPPEAEYSYPAVIQTGDGLVHVTYTWNRKKVKHVVIDPLKLSLREMKDGRWPE